MKAHHLARYGIAIAIALCGSGCSDEEDCTPTLEQWCGEEGCAGRPDLDEALEMLRNDTGSMNSAQHCGDRVIVRFSGGYTGSSFAYDAESGKLVGGSSFTDHVTDDECANQMRAAGEPTSCSGEACNLRSNDYVTEVVGDACEGELAEPFIELCLADPHGALASCKECACPACYPVLRSGPVGSKLTPVAIDCVSEHCADDCSAELEALEQAADD
jgi:hypothetical protein